MRIGIVYSLDFSVYRLRRKLLLRLRDLGHEVIVFCPRGDYAEGIQKELGARVVHVPFSRFHGPVSDLYALFRLWWLFRRERLDIVHNFTIKPNILGALAARAAGVDTVVALVAGLGYAFNEGGGWKRSVLRKVALGGYRIGLRYTDRVWFQNPDDLEFFVTEGVIRRQQGVLIRGSGVDLEQFSMARFSTGDLSTLRKELGIPETSSVVVMSARPLISKGVREYVEMARRLREDGIAAVCILIGMSAGASPEAVSESELDSAEDGFRWLGFRSDADRIIALADIVAHPSWYREGIPRSLLEALALGKPIVTTDHPGCRETVDHGVNGFLIPVRDSQALASAVKRLLMAPALRDRFGQAARSKAEAEFSENSVAAAVIEQLYGLNTQ